MVLVVTPPESYATPTISSGAKMVITMTKAYPPMMKRWMGHPFTMRSTPKTIARPTATATTKRSSRA